MSETVTYKAAPPDLVQITDVALAQIQQLMVDEKAKSETVQGLRLGVKGGGCSGLSYKIAFDQPQPNDYLLERDGVQIYIDPKSAIYLKGMTVDYQGGLEGKGFVFTNPNATSTCGCGESFSV